MPPDALPFPSLVAASRDDPFVEIGRAESFARAWGSRFSDLGRIGHINVESGHGPWADGLDLLDDLLGRAACSQAVGFGAGISRSRSQLRTGAS